MKTVRTSKVLKINGAPKGGKSWFVNEHLSDVSFSMPDQEWEDMGSPETITVSVEAGDLFEVPFTG